MKKPLWFFVLFGIMTQGGLSALASNEEYFALGDNPFTVADYKCLAKIIDVKLPEKITLPTIVRGVEPGVSYNQKYWLRQKTGLGARAERPSSGSMFRGAPGTVWAAYYYNLRIIYIAKNAPPTAIVHEMTHDLLHRSSYRDGDGMEERIAGFAQRKWRWCEPGGGYYEG